MLDDEGDDYTLFDLRDTGQVYWQDHETRDVVLRHDSLAGYLAKAEAKGPRPTTRAIATAALCERYQWLVWFLARPLIQDGAPTQTVDYLVRNGLGRVPRAVGEPRRRSSARSPPRRRRSRGDPHLAIYWLLHATALADDELRARVVAAIGDGGCELVRAFVARLGRLPASGDLRDRPGLSRAPRARPDLRRVRADRRGGAALACLRALEVSPHTSSLAHALQVSAALDRIDPRPGGAVRSISGLHRARADRRRHAGHRARARDARQAARRDGRARTPIPLARLLVDASDPWWLALEALWLVHELAYEGPALVAATRRIVARDRYHRRALQMAMRAAQIAGQSDRRRSSATSRSPTR